MSEHTINAKGPALVANGYRVCAIKAGEKRPREQGWPDKVMTAEQCEFWPHHNDGVGIICGVGETPICAVDADIEDDEAFANEFRDYITSIAPFALERVGKAPKFLMLFQAQQPNWNKTATAFFEKDGKRSRLEVLGKGQQFVAYHVHPDTGKPYEWTNEMLGLSPELTPAAELPLITHEQVAEIKAEFVALAKKHGYAEVEGEGDTGFSGVVDYDISRALCPVRPPLPGITIERARQMLKEIGFDFGSGSNDTWFRVGMALHHQFNGSEEAFDLWDDLSREFPEAYNQEAIRKRWKSFNSNRPGGVTFRWIRGKLKEKRDPFYGELSQMGALVRLLNRYEDYFVYVPELERMYVYDDVRGVWSCAGADGLISRYIRRSNQEDVHDAIAELGEDDPYVAGLKKFCRQTRNKLSANESAMISLLKRTSELQGKFSEFDSISGLFAVANGVVDLVSGDLLPYSPLQKIVRNSSVVYDPSAKCPTWERCVLQWMNDDAEMAAFVQRLFGSALTGRPVEDKLALLRGLGCNGKSVFDKVLLGVFGGYAEVIGESTLFGKGAIGDPGRARADIIKMSGARLAICSETAEMGLLREPDVKRLTGREPFPARAPYGVAEVNVVPSWLLCVTTNYMPLIKGDDDGIWRRIVDIEFPRNFDKDPTVKKDPMLDQKLTAEYSGVLNWLLEGLREYRRIGLAIPQKVLDAVESYRDDSDDVKRWMEERLIREEGARELLSDCLSNFNGFLKQENQSYSMSIQSFTRRLRAKVPAAAIYRTCGRTAIRGYRLKTTEDFAEV